MGSEGGVRGGRGRGTPARPTSEDVPERIGTRLSEEVFDIDPCVSVVSASFDNIDVFVEIPVQVVALTVPENGAVCIVGMRVTTGLFP